MRKYGKIIEPAHANIRDHERHTAQAIAMTGVDVEFVIPIGGITKSADIMINGCHWEMKSPVTSKMAQIEKNLKKASKQSAYIIVDTQRIKLLPDKKVEVFLIEALKKNRSIKRLLLVDRRRNVIDINTLI